METLIHLSLFPQLIHQRQILPDLTAQDRPMKVSTTPRTFPRAHPAGDSASQARLFPFRVNRTPPDTTQKSPHVSIGANLQRIWTAHPGPNQGRSFASIADRMATTIPYCHDLKPLRPRPRTTPRKTKKKEGHQSEAPTALKVQSQQWQKQN
ncbi:hypothetical protein V6N13_083379 [Hibiscus sabdariffa]